MSEYNYLGKHLANKLIGYCKKISNYKIVINILVLWVSMNGAVDCIGA